ncbi:MAG TPA: VWA domain-containing protein [Rubricoccaceae bacterium]|nr:VWA domain-containing protein [Rubricoccaceae bacterium]
MSFRTPEALWLLLLVPAAVALFAHAARQRRAAVRLFFGEEAVPAAVVRAARLRRWRAALATAALAALVVALAGPRYGTTLREAQQESLDLVFALDVSVSMLAEDVAPSRLERARLAIARMAEARRGDRLGLVVFAGDAFLQCPLTGDHAAFRLFLDAADPGLVATQGTDFANALFTARRAFADEDGAAGPPRTRAVVVVSDGEDHEGGLEDAADALRREGVTLLAVGVGTERGGPIPVFRSGQRVGYKTDASGERVVTRREEGALRQIAGDAVVRLPEERPEALAARLDRLDRTVVGAERYEAYAERYQWPLALAVLLLLAERLLALRRVEARERESVGA